MSKFAAFSPPLIGNRLTVDREAPSLVTVLVLSLVAMSLDDWFAPALRNSSPFWAIGFLLALILRGWFGEYQKEESGTAFRASWFRLGSFVLLHSGIVWLARMDGPVLVAAGVETSLVSAATASLKYAVLAPTLVLLAPADWLHVGRAYRAEVIVATGVLLTWHPYRIFVSVWPWYSAVLGRFVHALASLFVPGLGYAPGLNPTLLGGQLNVSIIFACLGLDGVLLFQRLFGLMLIVDWNRLNKRRLLISYFAGLTAMIVANALRITLLVVLGNRVSARVIERYHISAGWGFFAVVVVACLISSYPWLLRRSAQVGVSRGWRHPQVPAAL